MATSIRQPLVYPATQYFSPEQQANMNYVKLNTAEREPEDSQHLWEVARVSGGVLGMVLHGGPADCDARDGKLMRWKKAMDTGGFRNCMQENWNEFSRSNFQWWVNSSIRMLCVLLKCSPSSLALCVDDTSQTQHILCYVRFHKI